MVYISTTDVTRKMLSDYAKTKKEAEKIVRRFKHNVIVRLTSVFGPGQRQRKLIPALFNSYCAKGTCLVKNNNFREYLYVKDAAKEIVSAIPKAGTLTPRGHKIRNFELDRMIRAACIGKRLPKMAPDREYFFSCLLECVTWYRKVSA
jgi:nucleoside-diphosphate-sugar epimerase